MSFKKYGNKVRKKNMNGDIFYIVNYIYYLIITKDL